MGVLVSQVGPVPPILSRFPHDSCYVSRKGSNDPVYIVGVRMCRRDPVPRSTLTTTTPSLPDSRGRVFEVGIIENSQLIQT